MPVEAVNLLQKRAVKTLLWKVFRGATRQLNLLKFRHNFQLFEIVLEMIVRLSAVVEKAEENFIIFHKVGGAKRLEEARNWHGVVVNAKLLIDI